MKAKSFFLTGLVLVLLLTLTIGARAEDFKKGTYTAPGEGNWTIKFAEENKILVLRDGEVAAEGQYKINGGEMVITDESGPMSCGEDRPGKYRWHLEGKKLSFTVIEDPCEGRAQALTSLAWTRVEAVK
jgi:hypothetical protein